METNDIEINDDKYFLQNDKEDNNDKRDDDIGKGKINGWK